MTLRATNKVRRLINTLWRDGVSDEHKAVAFYRNRAKEFRALGMTAQADVLEMISQHEQIHKDILNEMIDNLNREIILKEYLEKER